MRYDQFKIKPTGRTLSEQELDEVAMGTKALQTFVKSPAAQGMRAGFEAELIFSGLGGDSDDYEPEWVNDYDMDERANSIDEIIDFFQNGEFSDLSDRAAQNLRSKMYEQYYDWASDKMHEDWAVDQDDYIKNWIRENEDVSEISEEELDQRVEEAMQNHNSDYESAFEEYNDEWQNDNTDESAWLRDLGVRYMTDAENEWGIPWPHMHDENEGYGGDGEFNEANAERLAGELESDLGVKTTVSGGYHSARRDTETWIFEPDSSLEPSESGDMPVEIVSPPMPLAQALEMMPKFFAWAESNGAYANKSTGFHMSVSMPEHEGEKLDYVKLALFLGDEYVLEQFGRAANTYARSAISKIRDQASRGLAEDTTRADQALELMRHHLGQLATRALAQPSGFGKYTSINPKDNYIEFRSAGGSDYFRDIDKIQNTLMRYAQATAIAMNPEAEKHEYAKKLYKLLTKTETKQVVDPKTGTKRVQAKTPVDKDAISIFSRFVAGEIPKAALKSFIKVLQHGRDVERQRSTGEMPKDYDPNGNYVMRRKQDGNPYGPIIHRFKATGPGNAIEIADKWIEDHGLARNTVHLANIENVPREILNAPPAYAPAQPAPDQPNLPATNRGEDGYVLRGRSGGSPAGPVLFRFNANSGGEAIQIARQWAEARGINREHVWLASIEDTPQDVIAAYDQQQTSGTGSRLPSQTDVENRLGWGSQVADANYEIVNRTTNTPVFKLIANTDADAQAKLNQWLTAAEQTPGQYIVRPIQRSAQQPQGEFTGQWKVVLAGGPNAGVELTRFGGIGNNQDDANRHALRWLTANGYGSNTEVRVEPVIR